MRKLYCVGQQSDDVISLVGTLSSEGVTFARFFSQVIYFEDFLSADDFAESLRCFCCEDFDLFYFDINAIIYDSRVALSQDKIYPLVV